MGKTALKTALAPQPRHGGARLPLGAHPGNTGGKKGRSGRKSDEFKAMCQSLASSADVERAVTEILQTPTHPHFVSALKWATEHGYGRPTEHVEHSGTVSHKHQVWKLGDREVAF